MAAALAFPYAITTDGIQLTSDEVYDAEDGLSVIRNESECCIKISYKFIGEEHMLLVLV